ncbi:hypothetical protein [Mycobacterium sp.]|uniref:hypothetical protein n=1 Tax=Mycobacterium sp. TaxID=1785 RepID=UPI003BAB0BDD
MMRPTTNRPAAATTAAPPTYTPAETAAAHKKLCEVYKLAARAVKIQTNIDNQALGIAALVNGAVMLEQAVGANSALPATDRATALSLAKAYTRTNAMGSFTHRDDPAWQQVLDDVNAEDARMKAVCGGS